MSPLKIKWCSFLNINASKLKLIIYLLFTPSIVPLHQQNILVQNTLGHIALGPVHLDFFKGFAAYTSKKNLLWIWNNRSKTRTKKNIWLLLELTSTKRKNKNCSHGTFLTDFILVLIIAKLPPPFLHIFGFLLRGD